MSRGGRGKDFAKICARERDVTHGLVIKYFKTDKHNIYEIYLYIYTVYIQYELYAVTRGLVRLYIDRKGRASRSGL